MFSMAHTFNLDVDFNTLMWARVFQSSGLAFLFIPVKTAAYAYLPRENYLDNFRIMAVCALAVIPLVFLIKRPPKGTTLV